MADNKVAQIAEGLNLPFGEIIKNVALGIAEGQFALDKSSMVVAEFMSGNKLLRDLDTGELQGSDGQELKEGDELQFIDSRIFFGYEFKTNGTPAAGEGEINNVIGSISIINGGSGYTGVPTVSISPANDATATATIDGLVSRINLTGAFADKGGAGYMKPPAITFSGGGGEGAAAQASIDPSTGTINGIRITDTGSGYTSPPTVNIDPPGPKVQAEVDNANIEIVDGRILTIPVLKGGSGYLSPPQITIPAAAGNPSGERIQATATALLTDGIVTGIRVDEAGAKYTAALTGITIAAPATSKAAAATAEIDATVTAITIQNPGTGFDQVPSVTVSGGGGSGAAARVVLDGQVRLIKVTNSGSEYDFPPNVEVVGDGTGATAVARVQNGVVSGFRITNKGTGYSEAQIVVSSGKVPERVPRKLSMMELGFAPNFYQFVDTVIEIKINIKMVMEETSAKDQSNDITFRRDTTNVSTSTTRRSSYGTGSWWRGYRYGSRSRTDTRNVQKTTTMMTSTVSPATTSKFNYTAEGSSMVRTKIVPIPPPAILEERIRQNMELDKEYQELLLKK